MFKLMINYPSAEEEARDPGDAQPAGRPGPAGWTKLQTRDQPGRRSSRSRSCNGQVLVDPKLLDYINALVRHDAAVAAVPPGGVAAGGLALMQGARTLAAFRGRDYAVPDDVVELALPALRHRVILSAEAEVEGHARRRAARGADPLRGGAAAVTALGAVAAEARGHRRCPWPWPWPVAAHLSAAAAGLAGARARRCAPADCWLWPESIWGWSWRWTCCWWLVAAADLLTLPRRRHVHAVDRAPAASPRCGKPHPVTLTV